MAVQRERKHQKHRELIMSLYEGVCHICSKPFADAIDHVVPVAQGGSDHPDNLRPAHTSCNSRKGGGEYPLWAEKNPNMWHPGHEPEKVRAERLRLEKLERIERARQEQEAAAARQRMNELQKKEAAQRQATYERELLAWNEKCATIAAIRADEPRDAFSEISQLAPNVISILGAIAVIGPWLFSDTEIASRIVWAAVGGFVLFLIFLIPSHIVAHLIIGLLKKTVLRRYVAQHEEKYEAWKGLLRQWEERPPKAAPAGPSDTTAQTSRSTRRSTYQPRRRYYRRRW